jgi:hypothetical protein
VQRNQRYYSRIAGLLLLVGLLFTVACGSQPAQRSQAVVASPGAPSLTALNTNSVVSGKPDSVNSAPVLSRLERVIPEGTQLQVRLLEALNTTRNRAGDQFAATLRSPVTVGGSIVLPTGTVFQGHVVTASSSGRLKGRAALSLALDSFELERRRYEIDTSSKTRVSGRHRKRNWALIGGGAGLGAALGAIAGGGTGALIGAGAGTAAGTMGAAFTGKKQVALPAEALLTFTLRRSVTISRASALP